MSELILHHFDPSPFAEKIRLIFGLKKLEWRSVDIPMIMPKPLLTALTGGYRKTPVLQVGADVYCDTSLIALELNKRFPKPDLFTDGNQGLALALSYWSNTVFFNPGAGLSMGTNADLPEPILKDRSEFFNFMDFGLLQEEIPHLFTQLLPHIDLVEKQLSDGRAFLMGSSAGWADINAYFVIWMLRANVAPIQEMLTNCHSMDAWEKRMQDIGHGKRSELDAGNALRIAKASCPSDTEGVDSADPLGLNEGDKIIVEPDDYGKVPVSSELIGLNRQTVSIRRNSAETGDLNIHFPRAGFRITRC
ncbi:MAG: glutathione S-transferase family protein [Gammaproteobacteria bacterium]|nr:glutathione S-transferase family protein [Gammaproteobacteria bacterium]